MITVAAVTGLILQGISSFGRGASQPQLGSFAGYAWFGQVTQVSASWTVPVMQAEAGTTGASTWIGVQGPQQREFFQIGTTEGTFDGQSSYEAFWSDPARGFHPQFLMFVEPNDEIHAIISESRSSWSASITDVTTSAAESAPTAPSDFLTLSQAEWLQEDPKLPSGPSPYPDIAPTNVSRLEVDGGPPVPAQLVPQWMALPHGQKVVPGPVVHDSFKTMLVTPKT
ncbi:MAG: G1 family glutamic endopeptidase [Acidimicrobiales bacterium]